MAMAQVLGQKGEESLATVRALEKQNVKRYNSGLKSQLFVQDREFEEEDTEDPADAPSQSSSQVEPIAHHPDERSPKKPKISISGWMVNGYADVYFGDVHHTIPLIKDKEHLEEVLVLGGKLCENVNSELEFEEFVSNWELSIQQHKAQAAWIRVLENCLNTLRKKRADVMAQADSNAKKMKTDYIRQLYGDVLNDDEASAN